MQSEQDLLLPLGDHQHSTRLVLAHDFQDATYVRQSIDYAPFGRIVATLGVNGLADAAGVVTAFGHHGSLLDAATGLQQKAKRWYSPDLGRFVSEDPIQDGSNWFMFSGNDPVNQRDPSGLFQQGHPLAGGYSGNVTRQPTIKPGYIPANALSTVGAPLGHAIGRNQGTRPAPNQLLNNFTTLNDLSSITRTTAPDYSLKMSPAGASLRAYQEDQALAGLRSANAADLADIAVRSAIRNRDSVSLFGETWVTPWNPKASGIGDTATAYAYATGRAFAGTASGAATGGATGAASGALVGGVGGAFFGGVGAVPGAIVGGAGGAVLGTVWGGVSGLFSAATSESAGEAARNGAYSGAVAGTLGGVGAGVNAVRGVAAARQLSAAAETAVSVPRTAGVQANRAAGNAVRDLIAAREAPALTEQTFRTVGGVRRVDVLKIGDEWTAIESKVGRTSLGRHGSDVRRELARDWWLQRQGQVDKVIWEFTPSSVTGAGGPTQPLSNMLNKLGFGVRINL